MNDQPQRGGWKYRDDYTPDIGWSGRLFVLLLVIVVLFMGFEWLLV